jgi:hypothetical protein
MSPLRGQRSVPEKGRRPPRKGNVPEKGGVPEQGGVPAWKESGVELGEAMRTQHACRYYRDDPVPDEVLYRAVELARFAPNGGNRVAVRFVFVRDPELRRQLGEWYLPLWEEVAAAPRAGAGAIATAGSSRAPGPGSATPSGRWRKPISSRAGSVGTR